MNIQKATLLTDALSAPQQGLGELQAEGPHRRVV
jgi:hypothetical protein